ncbi:Tn3 family transposase (plasmid) [Robbsia andropogonis]|uniref:Tn3 family transposase n=1 Tax=Robbsia andropogonis TaxID=28092 RepID=UPI003D24602B
MSRTLEGLEPCASAWNKVYLERAIAAPRAQWHHVDEVLLQHISAVHWNHVILTGDYKWRRNRRFGAGCFRLFRTSLSA